MSIAADIVIVLRAATAVTSQCVTNPKSQSKAIRPDKLAENDLSTALLGCVVVRNTGRDYQNDLQGSSNTSFIKLAIECYSTSSLTANNLADAVESTIEPFSGATSGGIIGSIELTDRNEDWATTDDGRETGEYVVSVQCSVFYRRN
jgi:hypothetical protein